MSEFPFGLDKYDYRLSQALDSGNDQVSIEFDSNSDVRLLEVTNGVDNADFIVWFEGERRQAKHFTVTSNPGGKPVVVIELLPVQKHSDFTKHLRGLKEAK